MSQPPQNGASEHAGYLEQAPAPTSPEGLLVHVQALVDDADTLEDLWHEAAGVRVNQDKRYVSAAALERVLQLREKPMTLKKLCEEIKETEEEAQMQEPKDAIEVADTVKVVLEVSTTACNLELMLLSPGEKCGKCGEVAGVHRGYPRPGHTNYIEELHARREL